MNNTVNVTELEALRAKLKDLRVEHRQLDVEISKLSEGPYINNLLVQRLKKRKLMIKDTIVRYESKLIPDLNA